MTGPKRERFPCADGMERAEAARTENCRLLRVVETAAALRGIGSGADFVLLDERVDGLPLVLTARRNDDAVHLGICRPGVWQIGLRLSSLHYRLRRMDRCFWRPAPLHGASRIVRTFMDGDADAMRRDLAVLALLPAPA